MDKHFNACSYKKKKNLLKMELDCVWRWREDENVISQPPRDFSEDVKDKRQE